jgi:hypothetical protein
VILQVKVRDQDQSRSATLRVIVAPFVTTPLSYKPTNHQTALCLQPQRSAVIYSLKIEIVVYWLTASYHVDSIHYAV